MSKCFIVADLNPFVIIFGCDLSSDSNFDGCINLINKSFMNGLYQKDTFIAWCLVGWRVTLLLVKMIVRSVPFNSCKSQQNYCVCYLSKFCLKNWVGMKFP